MKSFIYSFILVFAGFCISNLAQAETAAQKLAGYAPEDSVMIIAGSGSEKLADDFNQTVLHDLINDPSVKSFVEQIKTAVSPQINLDSDFSEGIELVKSIIDQTRMLKDPVVAGVVINKLDPKNKIVDGYLYILSTGGQAKVDSIKATIISAFEKCDEGDEVDIQTQNVVSVGKVIKFTENYEDDDIQPVMCLTNIGDHVMFILTVEGQEDEYLQKLAVNIKAGPKSLSIFDADEYNSDDVIIVYNYKNYFNMFEQMVEAGGEEGKAIKKMFDKMKLKELGTLYYRVSFKGKQIVLDIYGDQLRSSVFADFSSQVDMGLLKAVPVDATGFGVFNYSFEKIFNMYRDMIAAIDENAIDEIEKEFNQFQDELGVNLGEGLLRNITGEVLVSFKSNEATGMMGSSVSCLMAVKDADLFGQTIDELVQFAKKQIEGSPFSVSYNITEQQGNHYRYIIVPQLAMFGFQPTIVKLDDTHIVISSSSQAASETVGLWNSDEISKSILSNAKYKKAVANAPDELYSLEYTDSEISLKSMCATMNAYWPMLTMVAAQKDIVLPSMLPQVNSLFDELPPSISWSSAVGETGMISHIETDGVAIAAIGTAYVGVVTAIMSPAMHQAKEKAKSVVCSSNLKSIGLAVHMYSLDNDDKFPDSLDKLDAYVNEDGGLKCPEHKNGYIYRGDDLTANCDSQMILAYCPDHIKDNGGVVVVLFYDGHVESLGPAGFEDKVKKDNELRAEMGLMNKPAKGVDGIDCEPESETKILPEF